MVGRIFEILNEYYGCQNWWPAENEFEIVVGSVLTQNTNWQNVEKSLNALKGSGVMSPEKILALSDVKLQQLIYSSGFYRIKTKRLKAVCNLLVDRFDGQVLNMKSTDLLRSRELLLDTNGIGPETADDILLYVVGQPVFVVDTYSCRIFSRVGIGPSGHTYDVWQEFFMDNLPNDVGLFKQFHALIVRLGKEHCKAIPKCKGCPIYQYCSYPKKDYAE